MLREQHDGPAGPSTRIEGRELAIARSEESLSEAHGPSTRIEGRELAIARPEESRSEAHRSLREPNSKIGTGKQSKGLKTLNTMGV